MSGQEDLIRVLDLISWWLTTIKSHNAVGFFDINNIAEGVALKLLNEIYGYSLENLNYDQNNYPGIDLGDKINKIGFQISSRKDSRKFLESLEKFTKGPNKSYPNGIRFLILRQEKKPRLNKDKCKKNFPDFDPDQHILTANDLLQEIRRIYDNEKETFYRIKGILEEETAEKAFKKKNLRTGKVEHEKGKSFVQKVGEISKLNPIFMLIIAILGTLSEITFISSTFTIRQSDAFLTEIHEWLLLIISFVIEYIVYAKCLQNIVQQLRVSDSFVAWIPVPNILLMQRVANMHIRLTLKKLLTLLMITLFALVFFVTCLIIIVFPLLMVLFFMIVWSKIALKLNRSKEVGLLAGFPIIGKFAAIYIAYK